MKATYNQTNPICVPLLQTRVHPSTICHLFDGSARAAILFFFSLSRTLRSCSCQVSLNSVRWFQRSQECFSQSEDGRPSCFFDWLENINMVEDVEILLLNSFQRFQRSRKCLSKSEAGATILFSGPKNTDLEEDVEIMLPVKFR